ncbi:MAG TPA: NAD(P)/FAD-dependent oxidoreductase [Gemmatimonadales bacterium]|nr:NAD(P)/FAD-dependent oxidoreductase [Gemmatimonadales bacterium]
MSQRPHVVIVGGGFAGIHAARGLKKAAVDITLLDRTNHYLFQPLLYQVATAMLAPSDITVPIRFLLRKQKNTRVLMAQVDRIVPEEKKVIASDGSMELTYDYLILATGARHSYFGNDDWELNAPGLKSLEDALEIRRRFLLAFEHAETCATNEELRELQTFVVVGGGPTGVELAGMLPSVAMDAIREDFRRVNTRETRVILLEGGPRILPTFPESLGTRAAEDLRKLGVDVRTGALVTRIEDDAVYVGDERIGTRNVYWAAGNAASPLARSLGVELDRAGRVLVNPDLTVPDHPEIFVVGDLAAARNKAGSPVPGVAPAAMQGGDSVARNIRRLLDGKPTAPFKYLNKGDLATIGRHKAVAKLGSFQFGGYLAWVIWLFVHLMYLVGFRNRVSVLIQWAYAYFTYERGVRLITGAVGTHLQRSREPVGTSSA